MILVSDNQSSKGSEPGEGSLDYISSPVAIPESVVLSIHVSMILPVRRKKVDASLSEAFSVGIAVVCLVSDHSRRSRFGSAGSFFRDFDVCDDLLQEPDLSGRGRVGMASQRNTLAIDHHQVLRSLASLGFSDGRAPFFAGMNVASTKDSSQSRIPSASNSDRKARHMSLRTPASCQSLNRRQQVEGLGYSSGRSRHLAPVLRTQRIPSKHARSGAGGRPPFGLGGRGGINGLIFSHCSSVNIGFRALIGSPPMRLIREIYRKYNALFRQRYPAVSLKCGFCNHF
jgi:hypothetical protein